MPAASRSSAHSLATAPDGTRPLSSDLQALAMGEGVGHMSRRAWRAAGDVAERLKAAVC